MTRHLLLFAFSCAFMGIGCGSSPVAPSDPGSTIHADLASQSVFTGDCTSNLAGCAGEIAAVLIDNRYPRYNLPPGTGGTVRWCMSHPGLPNRILYISGMANGSYPEDATPSPVCVGRFVPPNGTCFGNGIIVTEDLLVEDEKERDRRGGPVFQFQTPALHVASSPAQANCPML